ncbi:neuromedin-U receptor 1 [Biomphalaria glabrata]|nr:neuromedin-U receptor 1-like [Biomphalaria glabrata]
MESNSSLTSSMYETFSKGRDLIDSSILPSMMVVTLALGVILQALGACMNGINVVVFFRLGLKDSVGLSFFVLSMSDFVYMLCNVIGTNVCLLVSMFYSGMPWANDFGTFGNFFIWYIVVFKDYTLTVSAFIALARCCLVALPFHFKSVFTLYRTCISLVAIFLFMVLIHIPMLFTQGLELVFDSRTNGTRLVTWQGPYRKDTLAFHDLVIRNIVPYFCIIVIAFCLIILSAKLITASKFRKGLSKNHKTSAKSSERDLSSRDVRVIKAVCFISGSYFLGFLPTAMQSFFRAIFPEFNIGKTYTTSFYLVLFIAITVSHFNSAINIVFYWMFNTKFREQLTQMLTQVFG